MKSVLAACFRQERRHWQCYQYSEMWQKPVQEHRVVPTTVPTLCSFSTTRWEMLMCVTNSIHRDTYSGNKSIMNWLKLVSQKAPYKEVLKWRVKHAHTEFKALSSFQNRRINSTAKIQRTAHHVCLPGNNKSWNTSIASGWPRTKPTWVLIKFGGLHTTLALQKLPSLLTAILQRPVNQWWTSLGQHWQWHITAPWTAPAQVTNGFWE